VLEIVTTGLWDKGLLTDRNSMQQEDKKQLVRGRLNVKQVLCDIDSLVSVQVNWPSGVTWELGGNVGGEKNETSRSEDLRLTLVSSRFEQRNTSMSWKQ